MADLKANLDWFLANQDDVPTRLHIAGVYRGGPSPELGASRSTPRDLVGGSLLGSPAMCPEFERWLQSGLRSHLTVETQETCYHVGVPPGDLCETCAVRDNEGRMLANTGLRHATREYYRWPMRAAMARIRNDPVPRGIPPLPSILAAIVLHCRAVPDLARVCETLAWDFPLMADPIVAEAQITRALRRVRQVYSVELPNLDYGCPERPRSEAQLNAEAAA